MTRQLQPCGTWAAYQRHRNNGEDPCAACQLAMAAKNRAMREADPATSKRRIAARSRALTRVKQAHPEEYRRYYAEEMRRSERGEAR